MAKTGGQYGNQNAAGKRTPWKQALKRALTKYAAASGEEKPNYRRGLDAVAQKVVEQAVEGNKDAWNEIALRIEGRPGQTVELVGDPDRPVALLPFEFVDAEDPEDPR